MSDFLRMSDSDLSEDEFKDERNLTDEQLLRKQNLMEMIRSGYLKDVDEELEGKLGNGKQPKVSLKQRIVERSKETGAALKSKLKDFQQKRKRREGDKQQTQASAEAEDKVSNTRVFGIPIMMAVRRSRLCGEIELPTVFRVCIDYLEQEGLDQEGIYRVSGVKSRIEAIKAQFDQGQTPEFAPADINTITGALKLYLRELPENILTSQLLPEFEDAGREKNVSQLTELISQLPVCNKLMIKWLLVHMKHISENSTLNKMSGPNLIIVFSPTLHISQNLLNFMFQHVDEIVGDTTIIRYNPKESKPAGRTVVRMLSTSEIDTIKPSVVSSEIKRLSDVLGLLHSELQSGQLTEGERADKDDEIWSVQRVLTQLKRKDRQVKGMAKRLSPDESTSAETEQEETYEDLWKQACELRVGCEEMECLEKHLHLEIDKEQATIDQLKAEISELRSNLPESCPLLANPDAAEIDLSGCQDEKQIINHLNNQIKDLLEARDQYVTDIALEQDFCVRLRTDIRLSKSQDVQ